MAIVLPKSVKEQKAWMKKLGITHIGCAELAILRDRAAEEAKNALDNRDYQTAVTMASTANGMQSAIEANQTMLKSLKL